MINFFKILVFLSLTSAKLMAASAGQMTNPDFTKGDSIPSGVSHDWTLGATGARGWIYSHRLETSEARQICITTVEERSPAYHVLKVGDVILGVDGKVFSYDARVEFGKALTIAEADGERGELSVIRWRENKQEEVTIKLPVMGNYSTTAPYDCPKSALILEQGCKAIAKKMREDNYKKQSPVTRSLNALALLASGDSKYSQLVRKEAKWASDYSANRMATWYYGYVIIFLAEYHMATGDTSVMPGLRRLALEASNGQSAVGSWGHRFANSDGRLGGYGMMNAPGVPLTTGLVLARAAGVKEPEIDRSIRKSLKLIRFYAGKGSIPYGDHIPWIETHEDNGKNGMAAVLFSLLGEVKEAEYFSKMSLASHGNERDLGHTGNFWNMAWAMPGVMQLGPHATGAWMGEFGSWYYDLARRWDGSFQHQGPPQKTHDSTYGWDSTGAYLLAYAMPLKEIYLTGKKPSAVLQLSAEEAQPIINAGHGWSNGHRNQGYDALKMEELLTRLESWSPTVRERAAMAIARHKKKRSTVSKLIQILKQSEKLESRYGACQALKHLGPEAAPAVRTLRKALEVDDLWLRVQAANALAAIGQEAMSALPELLTILSKKPSAKDPRGMEQRYLSFALFSRGGMLSHSLDGVDRELLFKAIRSGLKNEDGRARGAYSSIYKRLTYKELKPLLPDIYRAIKESSPSGIMFADQIRVAGLELLVANHVDEGIELVAEYARLMKKHGSQKRIITVMNMLKKYGAHAQRVIPYLQETARYFDGGEVNFPKNLSANKAKIVRDTIKEIEASTSRPDLRSIKD